MGAATLLLEAGALAGWASAGEGTVRSRVSSRERLVRLVTGSPGDARATPTGGLLLAGGGPDVDEAFRWMLAHCGGGDVVVLRSAGTNAYNAYLAGLGEVDSVETLIVSTREMASDPRVAAIVRGAEGIFISGGDQAAYLAAWAETPLASAVRWAMRRGAVVGGTSAGFMVLTGVVYSAAAGSVASAEALADPYAARVTLARSPFPPPLLLGVVGDSHFTERERMGRLIAFMARCVADGWSASPHGLGVDEGTALLVEPGGHARVVGAGSAYVLSADAGPAVCQPGQPLTWPSLRVARLHGEAVLDLATWAATGADLFTVSVDAGALGGASSAAHPPGGAPALAGWESAEPR